jgi:hypothetical protein
VAAGTVWLSGGAVRLGAAGHGQAGDMQRC